MYKNKCGEISQNHQFQIHSRSLPQTCCTSSTVQHVKEQDRRNPRRDDRAFGSTKPPMLLAVPSSSSSAMVCATHPSQTPSNSLSSWVIYWSLKLNSKNLANPPYALQVHPWINLHTTYSLHSFSFLWTYFCIGTPCYLSNWLMWYDWMNGTMLFLAKYLEFLKKNHQYLVSSN